MIADIQNQVPVKAAAVLEAAKSTIGHTHTYSYVPDDLGRALPLIIVHWDSSTRDPEDDWAEVDILCWYVMMDDEAADLNPAIRTAIGKMEQALIDDWNLGGFARDGIVLSEGQMIPGAVPLGSEEEKTWYRGGLLRVTYRILDLDPQYSNR